MPCNLQGSFFNYVSVGEGTASEFKKKQFDVSIPIFDAVISHSAELFNLP